MGKNVGFALSETIVSFALLQFVKIMVSTDTCGWVAMTAQSAWSGHPLIILTCQFSLTGEDDGRSGVGSGAGTDVDSEGDPHVSEVVVEISVEIPTAQVEAANSVVVENSVVVLVDVSVVVSVTVSVVVLAGSMDVTVCTAVPVPWPGKTILLIAT
jgi:hypothetical protein